MFALTLGRGTIPNWLTIVLSSVMLVAVELLSIAFGWWVPIVSLGVVTILIATLVVRYFISPPTFAGVSLPKSVWDMLGSDGSVHTAFIGKKAKKDGKWVAVFFQTPTINLNPAPLPLLNGNNVNTKAFKAEKDVWQGTITWNKESATLTIGEYTVELSSTKTNAAGQIVSSSVKGPGASQNTYYIRIK